MQRKLCGQSNPNYRISKNSFVSKVQKFPLNVLINSYLFNSILKLTTNYCIYKHHVNQTLNIYSEKSHLHRKKQ